ncbi:MAG: cytochrome biosis protein [Flaviaesturariibacter sp.]|nr:cytochrome biosis protein [Flaviaesturariibacter sp.]
MQRLLSCFIVLLLITSSVFAQDTTLYRWKVSSKKLSDRQYELQLTTTGAGGWQLYAPDQLLSEVPAAELQFNDSSIKATAFKTAGQVKNVKSAIFDGAMVKVEEGATIWSAVVTISGAVPAKLQGTLLYTYGKGEELYPSTSASFSVPLEGGIAWGNRIKIPSIDLAHPVSPCGDANAADNSLWNLFFIGFGAGLLALLFPCIFPLIPLTVSFFTKRSKSRRKGITNALLYGFSIFIIYTALSLPFHLFNVRPEILNNISTNVPLNIAFFIVFIIFAISFFGYFEIGLPSDFATKVDSKSGISDIWGIFFMALTLAVVSFSCTSGILGALLVGAFSSEGGAWQLTAGMAGFGLGLGLPFVLFALFPNWLQSLPKSGGWMNELKVVFGFIELAMAIKFLSNADLVKQWGLLKREVFLGIWALIGIAIVLYLLGIINFSHDSKRKFTPVRWGFVALFAAITLYLIPGMTNTKSAGLTLISGFPPPVTYTVYKHSALRENIIEPLHNDYEKALQLAREQGKPVLIDFTGWACVNCRRMEEKVWTDPEVAAMMRNDFVVVSLYVDERKKLPAAEQTEYQPKGGEKRSIITVGDKWATFQSENFGAVSQPQYAIVSPDEKALTRTKSYTQSPSKFKEWLQCGLDAYKVSGVKN